MSVVGEELNPYRIAQQQFDTAAEYVANFPAGLREYLRRTMRMTTVEFPVKEPSAGQVSARLDREIPRLNAALAASTAKASDKADSARLIAFIGLGVGAVGVILGAVALARGRRS